MSVEIKPYTNPMGITYPAAVYIDGVLLPQQTLKAPIINNGHTVIVECYTKGLGDYNMDKDAIPHQVKPYESRPDREHRNVEITTFYLKM